MLSSLFDRDDVPAPISLYFPAEFITCDNSTVSKCLGALISSPFEKPKSSPPLNVTGPSFVPFISDCIFSAASLDATKLLLPSDIVVAFLTV